MAKRQDQGDDSIKKGPNADSESGGAAPGNEERLRSGAEESLAAETDDDFEDADELDDEEEDSEGSF